MNNNNVSVLRKWVEVSSQAGPRAQVDAQIARFFFKLSI
jgi:hypothetical protein